MQDIPDEDQIPAHIPRDLLSNKERAVNGERSSTLFIRTWFGQKDDQVSQAAADAAYRRLMVCAMQDGDPDGAYDCISQEYIFDSRDELFSDNPYDISNSPDIVDGISLGTPGSVPLYFLTALMHCPDQFDGVGVEEEYHHTASEVEWNETRQNLLMLVADRKACETGWVLHLAVTHKGQVLPFRIRDAATWVSTNIANWDDGQVLTENTLNPSDDVELYMRDDDGWSD